MRFSNLHNHSTYSDGKGTLRENIEAAIAKEMSAIGFSDHSYTACDESYCMMLSDYPDYIREVRALKEEYKDKIKVYLGIEKDYYSDINPADFDYVIASVHYIVSGGKCYPIDHSLKQQEECLAEVFGGDKLKMAECYFKMVYEHVKATRPTFIGHYDVISKFGFMPEDDEEYIKIANFYLQKCLEICKYVEVNTGGIARGVRTFPYPHKKMLECIKENGGELLLSADSHKCENLDFYFKESVEILKNMGFSHIVEFDGEGFKKIEI